MLIIRATAKALKLFDIKPESDQPDLQPDIFNEWYIDIIPGSKRGALYTMFMHAQTHLVILVKGKSLKNNFPNFELRFCEILDQFQFPQKYIDYLWSDFQNVSFRKTNSPSLLSYMRDLKLNLNWMASDGMLIDENPEDAENDLIYHCFSEGKNYTTAFSKLLQIRTDLKLSGKYEFPQATVLTFRIHLKHLPEIWRTFKVNGYISFEDFHLVIQQVMGWENYHLHQFEYGEKNVIGDPMLLERDDIANSTIIPLEEFFNTLQMKMEYIYDFGDYWEHIIELVEKEETDALISPVCIEGEMNCPPENCGGAHNYRQLITDFPEKIVFDQLHSKSLLHFYPKNFNPVAINYSLTKMRR